MEGKCDAIFFWKKYGRFLLFTHIVFSKNPLWARYCQRIFPDVYLYFLFFYFFAEGRHPIFWRKRLKTVHVLMITLPMGRNGKDSGVPFGSAQGTAHDCARFLSQRMWGRNETDLFPWRECRTWAAGTWEAVGIGNGAGKTGWTLRAENGGVEKYN